MSCHYSFNGASQAPKVHNKTFSSVYELRSSFQSSGKADIFEEGRISKILFSTFNLPRTVVNMQTLPRALQQLIVHKIHIF